MISLMYETIHPAFRLGSDVNKISVFFKALLKDNFTFAGRKVSIITF
jgi:hypothetical protein